MNLDYKKASAEDIDVLFQLNKQLIEQYEDLDKINYEKVLKWIRKKLEVKIHEYQCILLNGCKVGYVHFYPNENMMELDDLYIFPEYRNQGIGTQVIEKCCKETACSVFLYVFIRNTQAVSLYKRLGFKIADTIEDSRYIMRKDSSFTSCKLS